jgi:uncharacterized protein YgiB involved in biofilm formation
VHDCGDDCQEIWANDDLLNDCINTMAENADSFMEEGMDECVATVTFYAAVAACMAEGNTEAEAMVKCGVDHAEECIAPYACASMFDCDTSDFMISFS